MFDHFSGLALEGLTTSKQGLILRNDISISNDPKEKSKAFLIRPKVSINHLGVPPSVLHQRQSFFYYKQNMMVMFRALDKIIFRSILTQVFFKTTTTEFGRPNSIRYSQNCQKNSSRHLLEQRGKVRWSRVLELS